MTEFRRWDEIKLRRRIMDAVSRATPWATSAEVPSDDIANAVLDELGPDLRVVEKMRLVFEAVTQADPGQPHVEFANIEAIAAQALGVESEVWK